MKTKILLVFALICMIAMKTLAQNQLGVAEACNPDCPQTPFPSPQLYATILLANGCMVEVQYCTRFACNTWHDLYIDRVKTINPNDPNCAAYFATHSAADLIAEVTLQMLLTNPMGFPPTRTSIDSCESNWRVLKGACWQKYPFNFGSPTNPNVKQILIACSPSITCCLDYYRVCLDSNGIRHITALPGSVKGTCGNQSPTNPGAVCEPVCN